MKQKHMEIIVKENPLNLNISYLASQCDETNYNPFHVSDISYDNPLIRFLVDKNHYYSPRYLLNDLQTVKVRETSEILSKSIYIKYAPLLDPIHFLIGKYESKTKALKKTDKIEHYNNTAYIDGFFNFLTSKLLEKHDCVHGVDFYGSCSVIQDKFRYNVADEYEYLQESEYFVKSCGILYENDDVVPPNDKKKDTLQKKPKIVIGEDDILSEVLEIDIEIPETENIEKGEMEVVYDMGGSVSDKEDDDDNSQISLSSEEEGEGEDDEEDDEEKDEKKGKESEEDGSEEDGSEEDGSEEDGSDDSEEYEEESFIRLFKFPVHMIFLEKCDGTLDELLEKKMLKEKDICSALMQVIFTLIIYQQAFHFTHNDLHTNNIVFIKTDVPYLEYTYQKKHYRVPTFGRIYKIIDFGRSIYRFQDKLCCSDSFAPGGDAHSQYNTEPYIDEDKARLEVNFSFDLCRLGCSMYDFLFDIDEPLPTKMTEVQKTILRWCQDDVGKNVLYKKNGEERYPNFKLYKMIARLVHQHTPQNQLEFPMFSQYQVDSLEKAGYSILVDQIPKYYT
jgi:hypothetical protein